MGRRLVGIAGRVGFRCATLTYIYLTLCLFKKNRQLTYILINLKVLYKAKPGSGATFNQIDLVV
jgi:hypothetical protein